jgi:hypothetical protein
MVGNRGRGRSDKDAVHPYKEKHEPAHQGPLPIVEGGQGTQQTGPLRRKGRASKEIKVHLTARRVRIDPEAKRAKYLNRLEKLIHELDGIIIDPEGIEDIQLQAMNVLIKAVRLCYSIVRDIDVEVLEVELEEIKERNRRAREKRGEEDLGYEIEEDPAT